MQPLLTVEFSCGTDDQRFTEESVSLHSPEELFEFVAPGGGCERIPDDVEQIRMLFLPPQHKNVQNPIADLQGTLQIGMVLITGPLSEIAGTIEQLLDKAGRGELSEAFEHAIGAQ